MTKAQKEHRATVERHERLGYEMVEWWPEPRKTLMVRNGFYILIVGTKAKPSKHSETK